MVTMRRGERRVPGPAVARRIGLRRALTWGIGVVLAGALLATGVLYSRQIWSWATHWQGGPSQTWPPRPLPGDPMLRLAAVGDVGDGSADFHETTTEMYEVSRDRHFDVVYLLGDNVYPKGDPAELEDRVLVPLRPILDAGAELRAVLGNHDVMLGRGDEQLELLGMPGRWHAVERGGVLLVGLDTEDDDPDQVTWLEDTLGASAARWKIVVMHRPPYSAGYQGSSVGLRELYTPIFERHGVNLVLSGHDHDYQRSVPMGGITYIVSGGGSDTRRTGVADFTAVAYAEQHFVDIAVYADRLLVRAIDSEGRAFDAVSIARDGTVTELGPPAPATPES